MGMLERSAPGPGSGPESRAWPAPPAAGPVDGTVQLPGSKSQTNRALVLAALANGTSTLVGALRSRDTDLMTAALQALGVTISGWGTTSTDRVVVTSDGRLRGPATIDVGNAGTVARFVPAIACIAHGAVDFDGDERVRERPLLPLVTALRELGARVDQAAGPGLPLTVHGTGRLRGGVVGIDATASSQLLSALLLVGPRCVDGIDVRLTGASLPSRPHVEMTVAMLRHVGALVAVTPDRWQVAPGELSPSEHHIEPDLSGAAAFLAAAAATAGHVVVSGWPDRTTQAGALLPDLLAEMGTVAELGPAGLSLRGPATLRGADLDLAPCGELAPVIAALAVLAATPSRLRGIAHLRGHETDRLAAFAREVNALGGDVEVTDDGWLIRPRPLRGGTFRTYDDHRLAMAAAVIGLVVPGVELDDVATTRKTMPDFAARWSALVAGADHPA